MTTRGWFLLIGDGEIISFTASNFPIRNQVLEDYIRVDYNDDPRHRHQGFGSQLSVALLDNCLNNGLDPQWDAATNDISVHLALKLGYSLCHEWKMYHLQ